MLKQKSKDLFEKCYQAGGNFAESRLHPDHYTIDPILDCAVGSHMMFQGKERIMWTINDYLGLANHPEIKQAALDALEKWGPSSPMGSRMISGTNNSILTLEEKMAKFCKKSAAFISSFGYLGVLSSITGVMGRGDIVVIDQLSHASMIDAATLAEAKSGKRIRPYKHNDMNDLERQLKAAQAENSGGILVVTEGVFGMSGDLGMIPEIVELKNKYGARLFVDDAHGFGVMGDHSGGIGDHFGKQNEIDIYFGTFAKAFVNIGGVTAAPSEVISYIRYNSRPSIFSKTLPMYITNALIKTLEIIETHPEYRLRMWNNANKLQKGLRELGFNLGKTQSPVTPVYVPHGNVELAVKIIHFLREEYNVFVSAVTYPVVPKGIILFRLIPTAAHTDEDIEITLNSFKMARDRMKLQLKD